MVKNQEIWLYILKRGNNLIFVIVIMVSFKLLNLFNEIFSYIYWTDLGSQHRVIRSRIDGHNRVIIASDLLSLEALSVDRVQNMVYFSYSSKVDVCDIHGYQRYYINYIIHYIF